MKTISKIIYLLLFLTVVTVSQTITFDRDYAEFGLNSEGYIVAQTSYGEYIIGGISDSNLIIVKTDSLGNLIFSKQFERSNEPANLRTFPVHLTNDGGFIITAGKSSSNGSDLFLTKLDADGNTIWEQTYQDTQSVYGSDVVETNDGDFLVIGYVEPNIVSLTKTDLNGNLLWSKTHKFNLTTQLFSGPMIIKLTDNNFLFANDKTVRKINADGDSLWQLNTDFKVNSIKTTSDENILVAGYKKFAKINMDGSLIWDKNLTLNIDCIANSADGNIALIQRKNMLSKFDSLGLFIRNEQIIDAVNYIFPTSDNGFIFTGELFNHLRLLKTKKDLQFEIIDILNEDSYTVLQMLSNFDIEWYSHGIENIKIEYSIDNGRSWTLIDSVNTTAFYKYTWQVPNEESDSCYIKISDTKNPSLSTISKRFKIQNRPIVLIEPNGGENLLQYSDLIIRWEGQPFEELIFSLSIDGGINWQEIEVQSWSDYYGWWRVHGITSTLCKIRATDKKDSNNFDESDDFFSIVPINTGLHDYISVNECFMWIGNNGMSAHNPLSDDSGFYWPGGENAIIPSIFTDGILWGGIHEGMIKVNGATYWYGLTPGKILPNGEADDSNNPRYKIYKIRKDWESLPDDSIKSKYRYDYENWPGDLGAPFVDLNGDGNFTKGIDEPDFIGDEVLFYVANDLDTINTASTYGSPPIGLEFQQTLFAYNTPELKDAVFKKVKLINKSNSTIDSMYISYWSDDDMGFAGDDLVGCDTTLSLGYTYNGDNNDEDGYGLNPPAVGHMLLEISNHNGNPVKSSKKLSSFININKGAQFPFDPAPRKYETGTLEYYNLMQGLDNLGGPILDPNTGNSTKFMVAGNPVDSTGWYDVRQPQDSRYAMTTGPFTMAPGDTQEVVYAIFMARGSDNIQSVDELKKSARLLHEFWGNEIPVSVERKTEIVPTQFSLSQNYPNPFNPTTTIKYTLPAVRHGIPQSTVIASDLPASDVGTKQSNEIASVNSFRRNDNVNVTLIVYDILGRKVKTLVNQKQAPGNYEVEFNAIKLASGMYFYRLSVADNVAVKKMMLLK